jgi:small neutral amino acid transporter SnatA (MarC family)
MRFSGLLAEVLHEIGIDLLSRIMGLLVAAIAVQLAASDVQSGSSPECGERRRVQRC